MKNIQNYTAPKYEGEAYTSVEEGIYKTETENGTIYVTALGFEKKSDICLEDILDAYRVYISDFFKEQDAKNEFTFLEFASENITDIRALRQLIE